MDVYWCVFIHLVAFCGLCVCKVAALCVVHNGVGSALLVSTIWAYQSLYAWNG